MLYLSFFDLHIPPLFFTHTHTSTNLDTQKNIKHKAPYLNSYNYSVKRIW